MRKGPLVVYSEDNGTMPLSSLYTMRKGPLVVYSEDNGIVRAFRNIPGVETACVTRLNLLKLAPGGNFGRFVIWTEGAFKKLGELFGTLKSEAPLKKGYHLPRAQMENADIARLINSTEVQSVLRPKLEAPKKFALKKNPLKNKTAMAELNPYASEAKAALKAGKAAAEGKRKERLQASREHNKKYKSGDETFYKKLMKAFEAKAKESENKEEDEAEDDE